MTAVGLLKLKLKLTDAVVSGGPESAKWEQVKSEKNRQKIVALPPTHFKDNRGVESVYRDKLGE